MDDDDKFVFQCVNMGVPINTARDIYEEITRTLLAAGVQSEPHMYSSAKTCIANRWEHAETIGCMSDLRMNVDGDVVNSYAMDTQCVRSMMVDTGCNHTIGSTAHNKHLNNRQKANTTVNMATKDASCQAQYKGSLPVYALNTTEQPDFPDRANLNVDMITVPGVREDLLSVDRY